MKKFEQYDTVFWDSRSNESLSGDYWVVAVHADGVMLTLEDDDGKMIEAPASECSHRDWRDESVPNWALCYLVNGDRSGLSEDEVHQVDSWLTRLRDAGFTMESVTDDTNDFCRFPAFGDACDTTRVRFYKEPPGGEQVTKN